MNKRLVAAAMLAILLCTMLTWRSQAQYSAELRMIDTGLEVHVTPRPASLAFAVAGENERPVFRPTGGRINVQPQWPEKDGRQIYVDGFRDDAVWQGITLTVDQPAYHHIGTITASKAANISWPVIDGDVHRWSWLVTDTIPAWDAALTDAVDDLIAALEAADTTMAGLGQRLQAAEADRLEAVARRDAVEAAAALVVARIRAFLDAR